MSADSNVDAGVAPEVHGCLEACRRCAEVVDRIRRSPAPSAAYARVGPHLRHCLDHFACLFRALDRGGEIDYDARDRDTGLETDPDRFASALVAVVARLRGLGEGDLARTVTVRMAAAPGGRDAVSASNLARELVFLSGHTIHHLALVRLLCEADGIEVPEALSMAYSTEAYRAGAGREGG